MMDHRMIPSGPRSLPLAGHVVPLLRDRLAFLRSLPAVGDLVRIRIGPLSIVVICDPELTHQALVNDRVFDKGGPLLDRVRELMGDGVATCPHHHHRRLRRLSQPAFQPTRLADYAKIMETCLRQMTDAWSPGQMIDVHDQMMRTAARITTETLFRDSLSDTTLGQLIDDLIVMFDGFLQRVFLLPPLDRLPLPRNRAYFAARARIHHTFENVIAQRRAASADHGDLLSALMAAHDPDDSEPRLSSAELLETVVTFFVGGTESSAVTLASALDFLAGNPHVEQRLHKEVDHVLGGAPASYAHLPRLHLAQHVIKETLRLRPPVWILTRTVTADAELGGYRLPAGTSVAYSPYILHHRPDLYPDPEQSGERLGAVLAGEAVGLV
ncbi:cytochrome P450, partial [Streptomyces spectabilis]|uniref:cytochrome P450 n=1 Tax=Streptomyces spectabilis TaxID=68270 RepID=UPI0033F23706